MRRISLACLLVLAGPLAAEPWRLQQEGVPEWLTVRGEARYRVELMDNTFRAIDPGFDQMTSSRTLLFGEARGERFLVGAELQDSRAWWHDAETPVRTDDVNAGEILQAYLGMRAEDVLAEGDELAVYAGRMTLSMGNQRIVARNGYRNTINGFVGGRVAWRRADGIRVQAFYTLPMERLPDIFDRDALRDNDVVMDKSSFDRVLWGVELADLPLGAETSGDLYLVGFREDDRPSLPARRRDHLTLGSRLYDETGPWQWELEFAWQWGNSRNTVLPTDTDKLDQDAQLLHAELSHVFPGPNALRLFARYEYASGDSDPEDGSLERYDSPFAARRRDFGLLGLYGPLFYSNVSTPAVGLKLSLRPGLKFETSYRAAWLAEKTDRYVGTGLWDLEGNSGDFIGHLFDVRLDWQLVPGQVALMAGAAYLDKGEFLQDAPLAPENGDTVYGVTQVKFFF